MHHALIHAVRSFDLYVYIHMYTYVRMYIYIYM